MISDHSLAFLTAISTPHKNLREAATSNFIQLPAGQGIYAIWWTGDLAILNELHRTLHLKGKQFSGELEEGQEQHEWLGKNYIRHQAIWQPSSTRVCLYVGKTANLRQRLRQHILNQPKYENWYQPCAIGQIGEGTPLRGDISQHFLVKHTTSCQVRAGLEHLFKYLPCALPEKLRHCSVSWVEVDCFQERFYLENLTIGHFRPWINLDCER